MSITSGFFNADTDEVTKIPDRLYDAEQMSSLFDGVIRDGIFESIGDKFRVRPEPTPSNKVIVGSGRCWFNHTWTWNDTDYIISLPGTEAVLKRYDAIIIDINRNVDVRANTITFKKGVPSTNPVVPTMTSSEEHHQYMIAYVLRTPGKNITAADITITTGMNATPWVTAPITSISAEAIITQMRTQWTEWWLPMKTNSENTVSALITDYTNRFATLESDTKREFQELLTDIDERSSLQIDHLSKLVRDNTERFNTLFLEFNTDYETLTEGFNNTFTAQLEEYQSTVDALVANTRSNIETQMIEFNNFLDNARRQVADMNSTFEDDQISRQEEFLRSISAWNGEFQILLAEKENEFMTWFEGIQTILDGDVAAQLTSAVEILKSDMTQVKIDLSKKADKTYVDDLVGDINTLLEEVISGD